MSHSNTITLHRAPSPSPLTQQQHSPKDLFPVPCKWESMHITTTSNSNTPSKSQRLFQTGFLQCRLPVVSCTRHQGRDKGALLAELTWQGTLLALHSHMTMTLMALTQHMHCISEQSRSIAVMVSTTGSSVWLGMSALP